MSPRIFALEVLRVLGVEPSVLEELRSEGLFEPDELAPEQAEELRVAATLIRDLGVNAAGVEVILHLRRRLVTLQSRVLDLLEIVREEDEQA